MADIVKATKKIAVERAKEPSSWLGAVVLVGTGVATFLGKPQFADPMFWQSLLNVASAVGLIAIPQHKDN